MKALFVIYILLSSDYYLVFPSSATATQQLHSVEHNGGSTAFPVTPGTGKPAKISCHKDGVYYVCNIAAKPPGCCPPGVAYKICIINPTPCPCGPRHAGIG
ncbi:hypothetical protein DITRI_Ditri13aG0032900 [Diplodiscus trichospermus]